MQQVVPKCRWLHYFSLGLWVGERRGRPDGSGWALSCGRGSTGPARSSAGSFTHTPGPWAWSLEPWGLERGGSGLLSMRPSTPCLQHRLLEKRLLHDHLRLKVCALRGLYKLPPCSPNLDITHLTFCHILSLRWPQCPAQLPRAGHPNLHPF